MGKYRSTVFASYMGAFSQAVTNKYVPLLFTVFTQEFRLSIVRISFLITLNFCTQMLTDCLGSRFIGCFGWRKTAACAQLLSALGLAEMGVLPDLFPSPYPGLCLAVLTGAVGSGLTEVLLSPLVEALPLPKERSVLGFLHSFYCWGTAGVVLVSTLFFRLIGIGSWRWLSVGWALLPAANALFFLRVPLCTPEISGGQSLTGKQLLRSGLFRILLFLMFCSGAAEQALAQWISLFAESGLGVSKALGDLLGAGAFSVLMGISRLLFGRFGQKADIRRFTFVGGALCLAGILTAMLSPRPVPALIGCGICGLAVGMMWPGIISQASRMIPSGGTGMFGLLALAGDAGCFAGPGSVGWLSAGSGTGTEGAAIGSGLPAVAVFALLLMGGALLLKKYFQTNDLC